jgi:O-antigen/teichoic acid export membrane protein
MSDVAVVEGGTGTGRTKQELRSGFAGTGLLSGAMLASGALAYAFHVLAARSLGTEAYGKVAVLWAALFLVVVVAYRPLEQTTSRAVAARVAQGDEVRTVFRSVAFIYGATVVAGLLVVAVAWEPVADRLFLGDDVFLVALVAGVYGYGLQYVIRGICSGARWFEGYGVALMADATARLLVALPLLVVASSAVAAAAVAVAGVAGALAPVVLDRGRLLRIARTGSGGGHFDYRSAVSFAGPAAVIAAADQILVNGGPLLVILGGGAAASETAAVVFAATMLVRIPVYLFQGPAASLLPNLTRLHAREDRDLFRRTVWRAALLLSGAALVIVIFAASIGPEAMQLLFGSDFKATRVELTLLGLGVGCYLAAATMSQALLALDRVGRAAAAWAASATAFVLLYSLFDGSQLLRIAEAFALSAACCALAIGAALVHRLAAR